jgi:hypothetical protein
MEDVGICYEIWSILRTFFIFYDHFEYFMTIWYILWQFGTFFPFWYVKLRKIWQPWPPHRRVLITSPTFFYGRN